ncbi:MAG TPA: T9SS type A sorting domain-containing protein [Flavobacterium sp.]|jgi:hypothetical protein
MKNFYYCIVFVLFALSANSQTINIPDANLKAKLLEASEENGIARDIDQNYITVDTNGNNEVELSEALTVYHLFVGLSEISTMSGIENFTNLQTLECSSNLISSLNITALTNLVDLSCSSNPLGTLNLTGLSNLQYLVCADANLTTLDLSDSPEMVHFEASYNNLTSVDITGLTLLKEFIAAENNLTSLDFTGMTMLEFIDVEANQLTSLDVSGCIALVYLQADFNQLTSLDISDSNPEIVSVNDNLLEILIIKNGVDNSDSFINFANNNLEYVCVDEDELEAYVEIVEFYGYSNVSINTYCTFEPGGTYYTVDGINRLDTNNDGCSVTDPVYPHLRFEINNGSSGTFIADESGAFSMALPEGSYTITPIIENPSYFAVTPASVPIQFPSMSGNVTQDFCVIPTGTHPDLEVTLVPLTASVPGFDTQYLIIYRNKGNQLQSGTITMNFADEYLDFLESNPATEEAGGTLIWGFINLYPSETREILVSFNINTPTDTPPVQNDDELQFSVAITTEMTDETPEDNIMLYNDIVVGSFDPNDKVCLQGPVVSPSTAGDFVHYRIRFENTGTFAAQNIVVRDNIDPSRFDISSLIPLGGSHSFNTRINGNRAEFIFEGINLPFDDANNDGYVVFKIRTLPTLVAGNSFSNSAEIYFDYNLPVITDPAIATFQALANPEFDLARNITVYPNPARNTLTINSNGQDISSARIYNMLGQLILTTINHGPTSTIDVSPLKSGHYFVEINTEDGISKSRFIKQ